MAGLRIPAATYRLQFNRQFRFTDARALIPYLDELGVTDLYCSPLLTARRGSPHGYDVTDPARLNPELGSEADFTALTATLQQHGMGLLLDIVPNHMAASSENPWWWDVLRNGQDSPYASYFDIDWHPARPELANKVLLPVLGAPFGKVLENQELTLSPERDGFQLSYFERRLPLSPISSSRLAAHWQEELNGQKGDPRSFDRLEQILSEQAYRLAYWRVAGEAINYRRFFDISDLVAMRVEEKHVFEATHAFIFRLAEAGQVTGLRIDHIDGLQDPKAYLLQLQDRLSGAAGENPGFYVVVEKILGSGEELPAGWLCCGTTGYDFLNRVNGLFVSGQEGGDLDAFYARLTGSREKFESIVYRQKKKVMADLFAGEVRSLVRQLGCLAKEDRYGHDLTLAELEQGFIEVTSSLAVYRTYIHGYQVTDRDREYLEQALAKAAEQRPAVKTACEFLGRVLLLKLPDRSSAKQRQDWLAFVMRWQQFTGPIMAKGYEDTALYIYNRLVSLNEVAGEPQHLGNSVAGFHYWNKDRLERQPHTLNATSTHDTKRSEDVRARINVLAELPEAWLQRVGRWRHWNCQKKPTINSRPVPEDNTEYLIYQTLVGAWPLREEEIQAFQERLQAYLVKATREAKIHTSWLNPDNAYEDALKKFVAAILEPAADNRFLPDFLEFQKVTAFYGAVGSLAQVLLKLVAPGVPDFYQGTESWNFSLADPDNRRPVAFETQARQLSALQKAASGGLLPLAQRLLSSWEDGQVKHYLTYQALNFRKRHQELFSRGEYIPIGVTGPGHGHVCAFARRLGSSWVMAVVPRLLARLQLDVQATNTGEALPATRFLPVDVVWGETALILPEQAPERWRNIFTAEILSAGAAQVAGLFQNFPVALLVGGEYK